MLEAVVFGINEIVMLLIMNKYLAKENEKKKAVGIGLHVRDLCLSKGVTRDNAETAALVAQQSAMEMAKWKDEQIIDLIPKIITCYVENGEFIEGFSEELENRIRDFFKKHGENSLMVDFE